MIGITEHKIQKENIASTSNIEIPGFHPFIFDCSDTTHGGTGFYVKNSIVYNRDDLKIRSPGHCESTFIEIIFLNKNMLIGCIYRHPSSTMSIKKVNDEIFDPLLDKNFRRENFDYNIDLLKIDTNGDRNLFYNNLASFRYTICATTNKIMLKNIN